MQVGVVGGTGPQGRGLAVRLAMAGHPVLLGSRSPDKAEGIATSLPLPAGAATVQGVDNAGAARRAELLFVTVPYDGLTDAVRPLADALTGKVVVSCVNPLAFDRRGATPAPVAAGSAAQEIAGLLPGARVVCAFNSVSAGQLEDPDAALDEDVLVCGDDDDAVAGVLALADDIEGLRGVAVGPLRLAGVVEGLTAVLIGVNRRHRTTAGVRLTGL